MQFEFYYYYYFFQIFLNVYISYFNNNIEYGIIYSVNLLTTTYIAVICYSISTYCIIPT